MLWYYNQTPDSDELYHHGVLGMKWGVRRYQNKDGSLTAAGKRRYSDGGSSSKSKSSALDLSLSTKNNKNKISPAEKALRNTESTIKETKRLVDSGYRVVNKGKSSGSSSAIDVSSMSDAELRAAINRLQMEKQYAQLTTKTVYTGKDRVDDVFDVLGSTAAIAGSIVGTAALLRTLKR